MNQQELLEHLLYDEVTGEVFWKKKPSQKTAIGAKVGYVSADGYMYFGFQKKTLKLHRAIFLMLHGYLPAFIDHVDHNRLNNRRNNLVAATAADNTRNCSLQKNNRSGVVGVSWSSHRNKWVAMIWHQSKAIPLGRFNEFDEAVMARKHAERAYGYHANHGM